MSVETPLVQESTPVVTKPIGTTTTTEVSAPPPSEPVGNLASTEPTKETIEAMPAAHLANDETVVEATPVAEGILGYKAPGLLKQFRFVKHFFWLSEEPLTKEAFDTLTRSEKAEVAHHHAAWARETGKGVLFYAKRSEDKTTPAGMIPLFEATSVTKVGVEDFSFKIGPHTHKFEASSDIERDSWLVAIEKAVAESRELKDEITGRESYKNTIAGHSFVPIVAGSTTSPIKSETPKKSLDAHTATVAPTTHDAAEYETVPVVNEVRRNKEVERQAKKERSQSRKRSSVFGIFGKKDEEKELKKEEKVEKKVEKEHHKEEKKIEKEHHKEEKKIEKEIHQEEKKAEKEHEKAEHHAEKEHIKEEKKIEAEHKKEEAKAEHDAIKAKEAAEAATLTAVPVAAVAAAEKKEERHEHKLEEVTTPSDKKSKRTSVFGGFFNKNKVTSPSVEKSEREVGPIVPAKDETPAVSEIAPKLDEPIDHKPIDAAAVTAPVNAPETFTAAPIAATSEEINHTEPVVPAEAVVTPRTERKSFLAGFMKKQDKKEEAKLERTHEEAVRDVAPTTVGTESAVVDGTVETPIKETEVAKEERPAREKRRTSGLFGSLGTMKRKTSKSPGPSSAMTTNEARTPETKREKSPMPSKLGGLFRKPSRATKTENLSEDNRVGAGVLGEGEASKMNGTHAATETPTSAAAFEPVSESIPDEVHNTVHDIVTVNPVETKTTA